jgi:predicted metal-dependent hydrolase
MHEYKVIRSNRKKVKLELSPSGLVIKAPYAMTDDQIAQIVREKSDWIAEHTAMIEEALQNRAPAEKLTMDEIRELADRAVKVVPERAAYFARIIDCKRRIA